MSHDEHVTVLIHGTFANVPPEPDDPPPSRWWRVTERGLAADRLRVALTEHDPTLGDTVWHAGGDPRDGDMSYEELVEWSSANRHRDRRRAARRLSSSLRTIADRRGCTPEDPLRVNYVAHSHGGNVVLESLKHVEPDGNLRPRQLTLLGTPLTWEYLDPRFGYLSILLFFITAWVAVEIEYFFDEGVTLEELLVSVALLVGLCWLAFFVIRTLRWFFDRRPGKPAYGPPPEEIRSLTGGRPVVLFISDEDEADLMLQLGAAPLDTYRALVRGRPSLRGVPFGRKLLFLPVRAAELLLIRPFTYAVAVPLVEILLERFGLGFPLRRVLTHNYEMLTWTRRPLYEDAIEKVSVDAETLEQGQSEAAEVLVLDAPTAPVAPSAPPLSPERQRIEDLRETLLDTLGGLKRQVHLSHSGYYQSPVIVEQIARVIAARDEDVDAVVGDLVARGWMTVRLESGAPDAPPRVATGETPVPPV